jgi:hypothetical protein
MAARDYYSHESCVSLLTSSILRFADPTQLFGGAHRGTKCMRVFIGVSVRHRVAYLLLGYRWSLEVL